MGVARSGLEQPTDPRTLSLSARLVSCHVVLMGTVDSHTVTCTVPYRHLEVMYIVNFM